MPEDSPSPSSSEPESAPAGPGASNGRSRHRRHGASENWSRILGSAYRIADYQVRIWLLQAKMTVFRMAIFAGLFAAGLLLALLAIIFLYIGFFRVLTDLWHVPPVWAYLIFGCVHLLAAGILMSVGMRMLSGKRRKTPASTQSELAAGREGGPP